MGSYTCGCGYFFIFFVSHSFLAVLLPAPDPGRELSLWPRSHLLTVGHDSHGRCLVAPQPTSPTVPQ